MASNLLAMASNVFESKIEKNSCLRLLFSKLFWAGMAVHVISINWNFFFESGAGRRVAIAATQPRHNNVQCNKQSFHSSLMFTFMTLLGAPGLTPRNKKLLGAPGITTSNKKLLGP